MVIGYSPAAVAAARDLRRLQTEAESRLWSCLRARRLSGLRFRRQQPIGPFVADFFCAERGLVVEVDGSQHAGSTADAARTAWLSRRGYRVLRCWNNDVRDDLNGVLEAIRQAAQEASPSPVSLRSPPSP